MGEGRAGRDLVCVEGADLEAVRPALAAALAGTGPALAALPSGPLAVREQLLAMLRTDLPLESDDVALVVPTSGSSGQPKGALLTAAALLHSARATLRRLGGPGHWVLALPLTHIAGLQVLVRSIIGGTEPVVMDLASRFDAAAFVAATARLDPTMPRYTALVPTQLCRLVEAGVDLSAYDAVLVGGAALRFGGGGVGVVTTYGMTETCGGCVYDGEALEGVEVVLDAGGRISIGGPVVFAGYRLRPDLTGDALVGGRHLTADLGRWSAAGRLEVLGRVDDVVITGGVNVPAAMVERALEAHPDVAACAAVGRPDPQWGQQIVAVVQVRPGAAVPSLAQLREAAAEVLEPAALPRGLVIVQALPLLASGKPDKVAVRALVGADGSGQSASGSPPSDAARQW